MNLKESYRFLLLWCLVMSSLQGYKLDKKQPMDSSSLVYEEDCNEDTSSAREQNKESCKSKIVFKARNQASSIAFKAAQEAKDASDAQLGAAECAAHQVKVQLADKALAAAKAAEAALSGKQQIVEQLESEVHEGELVVQEETVSLQTTQGNCNAAAEAAKQSCLQLKTLTDAIKTAQCNVHNSEQAANGAQQELSEKQQLVEAAKKRVDLLLRQLDMARCDFKNTKMATERAACAAREAKQRATRERRRALMNLQH